jgi:hypothetical protein
MIKVDPVQAVRESSIEAEQAEAKSVVIEYAAIGAIAALIAWTVLRLLGIGASFWMVPVVAFLCGYMGMFASVPEGVEDENGFHRARKAK